MMEKKVGIIAWIPISLVELLIASILRTDILYLFYMPDSHPDWISRQEADLVDAMGNVMLFAAVVMMIAGQYVRFVSSNLIFA